MITITSTFQFSIYVYKTNQNPETRRVLVAFKCSHFVSMWKNQITKSQNGCVMKVNESTENTVPAVHPKQFICMKNRDHLCN